MALLKGVIQGQDQLPHTAAPMGPMTSPLCWKKELSEKATLLITEHKRWVMTENTRQNVRPKQESVQEGWAYGSWCHQGATGQTED